MKKNHFLHYIWILIIIILALSLDLLRKADNETIIARIIVGTSNPGNIELYSISKKDITKLKTIRTGYKHVHSVRVGDIYNNGMKFIVAGISNGLTVNYPNCRIMAYKLDEKLNLIDQTTVGELSDLRCKDLAIGDIYNQGKKSIIVGTHGKGIIQVFSYENNKWRIEEIERNFIGDIEKERNVSYAVNEIKKRCPGCLLQSEIGAVKINDIDGDGKNELIISVSSPLENTSREVISLLRTYKWKDGRWNSEIIDEIHGDEIRTVVIGDIFHSGKNSIVVGIGSLQNKQGFVYAYNLDKGKWKKNVVWEVEKEVNIKRIQIVSNSYNGTNKILVATGFPQGRLFLLNWDGQKFQVESVGALPNSLKFAEGQFNPVAVLAVNEVKEKNMIFASGIVTSPDKKIGWEETNKGYIVSFNLSGGKWNEKKQESQAVLSLDNY